MDFEEIRRLRERIANLAARHADILQQFWNAKKFTFGQFGPDDAGSNVTTACTCVLSFLEVPRGCLPDFLKQNRTQFLDWLLAQPWKSEDLVENNPYTAPLALTTVLQLTGRPVLNERRPKAAVERLMAALGDSKSGGIASSQSYPPSGYLTYWTVRALWDALTHRTKGWWDVLPVDAKTVENGITIAANWAEDELHKHIAYYSASDLDRYDALQLGYAMAIEDFVRAADGRDPDQALLTMGLKVFFASQLSNGLWSKAIPLFHYPKAGSVYPFAFETLTAVMRLAMREFQEHSRFQVELFEPHLESLQRSLSWVESHELVYEGIHGWRSNTVLPGPEPQAWATAMALCFVRALDALLQRIVQERLLKEFSATRFPKPSRANLTVQTWCPEVADSTTPLAVGGRQSLKKLLFDHLIEPRLPQAHPDAVRRLRWSAVFFGPPGTAKTRLVSEIAKALGWPLVTIETSDLLALGVDRMAHQTGLVFRKFEQLREVVIFIDEVEEFVRTREDKDRESRLTTTAMLTLIQKLRGLKRSILILATNHVDTFDPAIIRPGRFDLLVLIKPPNVDSKIGLWKQVFGGDVGAMADDVFRTRAEVVERFTFIEWKTFMDECKVANEKKLMTREQLAKDLDEAGLGLTIDDEEWARWASHHRSRVSQGE
jgi:hypothetical protein